MQVQPTAAASAATTGSQAGEQAPQTKSEQDFQTFLRLLTAQMRNQDPLEPLDATQFVAQLASFSSVEQQIDTNAKLDVITEKLSRLDYLGLPDTPAGEVEETA